MKRTCPGDFTDGEIFKVRAVFSRLDIDYRSAFPHGSCPSKSPFCQKCRKCKKCKKCKKLAPNVKVSETCHLFNGCQKCAQEKVTFPLKLRGPPPGGRPAATKVRKSLSFARVYCVYARSTGNLLFRVPSGTSGRAR